MKADELMVGSSPVKRTAESKLQFSKALSPTDVTLAGMETEVSAVQSRKAESAMEVTGSPSKNAGMGR